jgi:hypothetical protein
LDSKYIFCTLVTMTTSSTLNLFNPSKAATHYGWYSYKASWSLIKEINNNKKSPLFCFHNRSSLKVVLFVLKIFKMAANIKIKKSLTIQKWKDFNGSGYLQGVRYAAPHWVAMTTADILKIM